MMVLALAVGGCAGGGGGPDIGELESQHDVEGLVEAALDGDDEAVAAIRRLEDPAAYTLLGDALNRGSGGQAEARDGVEEVMAALDVLGALGGPSAATVIVDWTRASYAELEYESGFPEPNVVSALTEIASDPAALGLLVTVLQSPIPPDPADLSPNVEYLLHVMVVDALGGRYGAEPPVSNGPVGSEVRVPSGGVGRRGPPAGGPPA